MKKKMKKVSLYIMALLSSGLVSCNQDFETIFSPQTNAQESLLQASDVTVANTTPTSINLADYIDEAAGTVKAVPIGTASVKEGAMPANTILKAMVEFSKDADFSSSIMLNANSLDGSNEISVNPNLLQDSYFNDITRNPATTDLYIRTILYTVTGGTSEAIVGKPEENYYAQSTVKFTPLNKVQISPAYYVIGAAGGWSADGARTQKFNHSGADVYVDPVFSVVVDAGGDDCWFAIGDDAALDAIANDNDWTKLLGTKGASEDLQGSMDFRYNLGGDHSFHVTGAKKLKITIDMMDFSYTIEPINVADAYYLIGGPEDWAGSAASKSQKFSHSSASVADDPVFTYVLEGTGGDIWFAIGDDEACDAITNDGDWSKLFGTTKGNGENGLSGSLSRRSSLSDDGSFKVDGTFKFIRVQINMAEMTYTITPLNFNEYIYEAGVNNNWGTEAQPLYCGDGNGTYKGFFYAQDADWSGGKGAFKFQAEFNNWDVNYGFGSGNDSEGTLAEGGDNIMVTPGFYYAEIDIAAMTYKLTSISGIGIIGPAQAGGWDNDTDLAYNPETRAWEGTVELAADEFKFRANDGWDINWGGSENNLTQNGANMKIAEAGKYFIQFFPTCENKSYCKIEKK
jgi:hypothetical protein